jgi:hypothetical protein
MAFTVFEKIWNAHALAEREDGQTLLYIDRHLTHEVTSPLAFEGLRMAGRRVRRPDLTFAVMDHNVPTTDRTEPVREPMSAAQMAALRRNAKEFGIMLFDYFSPFQGIVHVIGPELGLTLPGITLVCGDSHTSTHGALRGPRIRHRDKRGRARLRNPDALDEEAQADEDGAYRPPTVRGYREGRHPLHHQETWDPVGVLGMWSSLRGRWSGRWAAKRG